MVEDSADLEIRIRRVFREAVEAMYPTKMFHIDVTRYSSEELVYEGPPPDMLEDMLPAGMAGASAKSLASLDRLDKRGRYIIVAALLALPFLPSPVCGKNAAEALAMGLQWTAYRVRNHGPPRLESEAERWINELIAMGVELRPDTEIQEWESRVGRGSWLEEEGKENVECPVV